MSYLGGMYADGKPKPSSKGSKGAELVGGLVIKEEDYKVVKTRFSAFSATNLHSFLQGARIDSLVIVGKSTFSALFCYNYHFYQNNRWKISL